MQFIPYSFCSTYYIECFFVHLHVSAYDYADIVKEILKVRPSFCEQADKNRCLPLHYASRIGNVEITKFLLNSKPDMALQYNNNGYTPLHQAAINGHVKILEAFIASSPTSFNCLTTDGDTVFHLALRFGKYNAFIFLAESFDFTGLLHQQDQFGNTVLHLAILRNNYQVTFSHSLCH